MEEQHNEGKSLLKELIKLAKADKEVREIEFQFLLALSSQMGISKDEFVKLFEQYIEFNPPKMEFDRILQFQRLVLIMNVDQDPSEEEFKYIREIGIRMGLHPMATEEILKVMNNYPNKVIPPEKLIEIFRTFHN